GVLHRDVKPSNILLSDFGEPLLADFGIARVTDAPKRTRTGVFRGTLLYAAPELLAGASPSVATDVYSLCASLYELVAGRPAFSISDDDSDLQVLRRLDSEAVPSLGTLVPPDLDDLLQRGMSKDPADRPATADLMGRALQRIEARHGAAETIAPRRSEDLGLGSRATVAQDIDPPTPWRRTEGTRRRRRSVAVALVAAVVSISGIVLAIRETSDDPSDPQLDLFPTTSLSQRALDDDDETFVPAGTVIVVRVSEPSDVTELRVTPLGGADDDARVAWRLSGERGSSSVAQTIDANESGQQAMDVDVGAVTTITLESVDIDIAEFEVRGLSTEASPEGS
ncbi:MAG TPA: serine/threonine-protein kinase, partial [Acidimicrobiales bacterium]|nr:serine/threonine-protein kinase [Acidimicrobiales bacterium]